jgi:hypothetical protein
MCDGMRVILVLPLVACHPMHDSPPDASTGNSDVLTIKSNQNPDLDLLFVVDDSPSMADKQLAFTTTLPLFLDQLSTIDGGRPNIHFGVASSDMGTKGSGSSLPAPSIGSGPGACIGTGKGGVLQVVGTTLSSGNFLVDSRDGTTNYTGALVDAMTPMLKLGQNGCGFEQHLGGMRAALDANPMNTGFLRPSANLAVIVLGDEDDCSVIDPGIFGTDASLGPLQSFRCFAQGVVCDPDDPNDVGTKASCKPRVPTTYLEDPETFKSFLLGLKGGDARMLMFGAVVGDPTKVAVELVAPPGSGTPIPALSHSCNYTIGAGAAVADPPVRIASLASTFPGVKRIESVCSADLSPALGSLGKAVKTLVGDTCLAQPIADPSACTLVDKRDSAPDMPTTVPACGATKTDCWELVTDTASCPDGQHVKLVVHRSAPAADDSWSTLSCAIE